MAAKMYKFRLARALEETREMSMSLESTWDAIHQNISAGFSSKMTGGIRFLQVVKSANSEAIGERITDAGKFWLAIVKWYDANSTVFLVYDDSLVELELQLLGPLSPVVKAQTPFMGTYSDLVSVVYRCYPYLSTGAARHEVRHFSAVRGGAVVDMKFTSAEQLWDWYTAIVSTRDPPRFVIAIDGFARIDVATSVCEKFSIYVPKDCAMDMLNTIILETVVQLRCSRYDVESISVRSARGSEDLTSTDQLPALFNVSTSWLYASLRSVSEPVVASRKPAATPASPSTDAAAYSVRFCLRGDRSVFCTVKLSQGCTIDEIKSAVAAKCTSISGTDIKHFILLDKDGDEFSSGLDTVTKFWRIAVKYFKDNFSRDFIFNVVLNPLPASSKKPTIKPEMNVPSPEPNVQAFVPPRALSPVSPVVSISTATTNDLTTSSGMKSSPAVNSSSLREKNSIILDSSHSDIKVVKTEPMEIVLAKTATAPPILVPAPIPAAPSSIESIMIAVDVKKSSHDKAEATKSNDVYKAAAPQTAIPGTIVHFKLTAAAQKSIMPSRRLELMRKKERDGGSSSIEADLFTIQLSYGCSWNAVLDAVCKATGIPAPSDISHFVPTVGGKPVQEKASDSTLIVDRFQFWAIMKRAGSTGEIILWEVHVGVKFSAPGLQSPKIGKGDSVSMPQVVNDQRSVVVSVALSSMIRVVRPALIPLSAPWEEIVEIVCEALNIESTSQTLTHFIVYDKDGDQLTTEISSAAKFWKVTAFGTTVLRVYIADKGPINAETTSPKAVEKPTRNTPLAVVGGLAISEGSQPSSVARTVLASAAEGLELLSVTIAHARFPRKEVTALLKINSSWSSICDVCSRALLLDSDISIAYIMVFDREDRKFGSAITASDRFWKNLTYNSHHVLRMYTVACLPNEPTEGAKTYRAALSSEPAAYKIIPFDAIPTMDEIRKSVSAHFKICADIILHVVFFDSEGDELSGPLNVDSKLSKFFQHKEIYIRIFTSIPPVLILPRFTFVLESANGPPLKNLKTISVSRSPTWDELRLEIAEELNLEKGEQVNHVVFVDDEGDELSGNVNNDIKVSKFANSAGEGKGIRLRVYLDLKEKSDSTDAFFALVVDENIAELDKLVSSKLQVDKTNPVMSRSAFLTCCELGKMESLKWLLQKKANINQRTPDGSNGLHIAIASGCDDVVGYLVAMGISVFEPDGAQLTPFLLACSVGNIHAAKLLLRKGAKTIDSQRSTGYQGIHLAVLAGHFDLLRFLVEENSASLEAVDKSGLTPFLLACSVGQLEAARWLSEKGCNLLAVSSVNSEDGGSTALHYACKCGFVELVIFLLDLGIPADIRDIKGLSAVEKAKQNNHFQIADMMLDREIQAAGTLDVGLFFRLLELRENTRAQVYLEKFLKDVKFKYSDEDKILLLHLACACGHIFIVEYFIMVGCDINSKLGAVQATPLMQAAKYGQIDMVKYLVAHGGNISMKDVSGVTAMQVAVLVGQSAVAAFLDEALKAKELEKAERSKVAKKVLAPEVVQPSIQTSNFGMLFACISGMDANPSASQLFAPPIDDDIESAPGSEADGDSIETAEHSQSSHTGFGDDVDNLRTISASQQEISVYPLHNACRIGASLGLIEMLIDCMQGRMDSRDDEGYTCLYIASALSHWNIVDILIDHGADVALLCSRAGETPLHVICHYNVVEVLRKVLNMRALRKTLSDINLNRIVDVNGNSLLHAAVLGGAMKIALMLVDETEINLDGYSDGKRTPLLLSCIYKHPDLALALIERDADIFIRDEVGGSALLYAVKSNEFQVVRALIAKGADVKDRTETGNTAMHIVCQTGNLEIAMFLVSQKASLLDRNEQDHTPYTYAVKFGHIHMMQWIATVDRQASL